MMNSRSSLWTLLLIVCVRSMRIDTFRSSFAGGEYFLGKNKETSCNQTTE